jgi:hypothetical protein
MSPLSELESRTLAIEHAKLDMERDKLMLERDKAKWTAIAVVVPLLGILVTGIVATWQQSIKARDDFRLKAAEIMMATDVLTRPGTREEP